MSAGERERLGRALAFAMMAHHGQTYRGYGPRANTPYILHPLRVAFAVSERARVVALLHDVLEDTNVPLPEWVTDEERVALFTLTRGKDEETYAEYIARIVGSGSEIAREVKIADLRDNLAHDPPPEMRHRYEKALAALRSREGDGEGVQDAWSAYMNARTCICGRDASEHVIRNHHRLYACAGFDPDWEGIRRTLERAQVQPPAPQPEPEAGEVEDALLAEAVRRAESAVLDGDNPRYNIGYVAGLNYARNALRARSGGGEGWRPIDSAPRDGTEVLLWVRGAERIGRYEQDPTFGGWWELAGGVRLLRDAPPTHWMPRPAPPVTTEGA